MLVVVYKGYMLVDEVAQKIFTLTHMLVQFPFYLRLLLDGDGFRQVARLIHVAAAAHGDVIGQQLQRHDFQDRRHEFRARREFR